MLGRKFATNNGPNNFKGKALLQQPTALKLNKKFPTFYETRIIFNVCKKNNAGT
jgi:hypothetical protein